LNRREIARVLNLPDEMPLVGGLSPDDRALDLYREGRLDPGFTYDPGLAARLLEQRGWVDRNGDGVREREGTAARFTFLARQGGILATLEVAILLQHQLRAIGVGMEILTVESAAWYARFLEADFDVTIHDVRNVPTDLLRQDFFGDGTLIGYRSPEVVQLLEALVLELDPASQDTLYSRINEILVRDVPLTFLFPYYEIYVAHRKIHGLHTPERPEPIGAIMELWIQPYPD
jgi:peptide/nickel transport system substrate-binding protein